MKLSRYESGDLTAKSRRVKISRRGLVCVATATVVVYLIIINTLILYHRNLCVQGKLTDSMMGKIGGKDTKWYGALLSAFLFWTESHCRKAASQSA